MNRRSFLRTLGSGICVTITAGLTGCTSSGDPPADTESVDGTLVEMTDRNAFEPEIVTVSIGESAVWRNVGTGPHTVTVYEDEIPADTMYFASGGFESEDVAHDEYSRGDESIGGGDEYEYTFAVHGRYESLCLPHESSERRGTVIVEQVATGGTENLVDQSTASQHDTRRSVPSIPADLDQSSGRGSE